MKPLFEGVCTALITPFDHLGQVDFPALERLIDWQIDSGVAALCVCGTTGEGSTLTPQEQEEIIRLAVRRSDHRIPILAGAGSNSTATACKLSRQAQLAGADGLLLVTPYYNKTSPAGLVKHYETIAAGVDLPMIVYNVPSRTGLACTAELYQALSQIDQVVGIKEASGDLSLVTHTRALCGERLTIWSGNDDQIVPLMALGAKGVISVLSNLVPEATVALVGACLAGDFQTAAGLQLTYTPLIDALFSQVNPIPIKAALARLGRVSGTLRLPLCEMEAHKAEQLYSTMEQLGLTD